MAFKCLLSRARRFQEGTDQREHSMDLFTGWMSHIIVNINSSQDTKFGFPHSSDWHQGLQSGHSGLFCDVETDWFF